MSGTEYNAESISRELMDGVVGDGDYSLHACAFVHRHSQSGKIVLIVYLITGTAVDRDIEGSGCL